MKVYQIIPICLAFFLLTMSASIAADNNCSLHIDKTFYAVGENLNYHLFLPNEFEQTNVAVRVILLNSNGSVMSSYFENNDGQNGINGTYRIPYNLAPGMYYLQFLAAEKESKKEIVLVEAAVPIYNFLENIIPTNAKSQEDNIAPDLNDNSNKLKFNLPDNISARENVNIQLETIDGSQLAGSKVSVSVINEDLAGNNILGSENYFEGQMLTLTSGTAYESELYNKAKLLNKDGQPIKANIIGAYSSLENKFLFTKSNEQGEFHLSHSAFDGSKPIQIVGYHIDHNEINVEEIGKYQIQNPKEFYFNDKVKAYLELCRIRKKIEQHFDLVKQEEILLNNLSKNQLKPDASYNIREYQAFENMASFFKEVLTPLRFRTKKDSYEAFMYDPTAQTTKAKYYEGLPLFIIDGKLTRNGDYIARLDMAKIDQVDLFFLPKNLRSQFNAFGRFGVVRIVSNDTELSVPEEDSSDILHVVGYNIKTENKADIGAMNRRTPILDPQVFWSTDNELTSNGNYSFSFLQPDDPGQYTISVIVQSGDGNVEKINHTYEVMQ